MSTITILGLASLVFVIGFTLMALRGSTNRLGRQTRRQAIIESWINILVGFILNFGINLLILPMLGITLALGDNFFIGCIYTAVSVVRSFMIRRYCDEAIHTFAARAAERIS